MSTDRCWQLDQLAGNDALKQNLKTALTANRLPHSILLVGEQGCGAGFAARCLAADYLYPHGGPHAAAVLRGEDAECIAVRGEGASGQIKVERIREAREAIQHSALSQDAAGRVLFVYGAQNLNGSSANAMLKIIEEPPEGVLFVFTATSAASVMATIRSRCAAYTLAPVPVAECAAALRRQLPRLTADQAEELAFLYEGHLGTCLDAVQEDKTRTAQRNAAELCALLSKNDLYRATALLSGYEKDREGAQALLWQAAQYGSAALRQPGFAGLTPAVAAFLIQRTGAARRAIAANGNLRLVLNNLLLGL